MTRSLLPVLAAAWLAGCTAANASPYDSSDPAHCVTVFSVTSGAARTGPLADELNARIHHLVLSQGGVPWLREITPATLQLAARWEALPDKSGIIQLFDECRGRQDADPNFQAAFPALLKQWSSTSSTAR